MTRFAPAGPLRGSLRPPSDKSISHRAALIAAMGEGGAKIRGYLEAADTESTLAAVASSRARSSARSAGKIRINGVGLRGPRPAAIDVGNAGTLLRLLPGWLAGQEGESGRSTATSRSAGGRSTASPCRCARWVPTSAPAKTGCRRCEIRGANLHGVTYELPVASAQVKSCLLFAGLLAEGQTTIVEPLPTRDHSERMLAAAGARIERGEGRVTVYPAERLEAGEIVVPADLSSAAFLVVAGLLVPGSEVTIEGVGLNPTRIGLLLILERMGARIETVGGGEEGGEPVGDLRVFASELHGTEVGGAEVPLAIDELPLVALAACFAEGRTTIRDAAELRRKESDRIATVTAALTALGGKVEATADGIVIEGSGGLRGGTIESHGDHRIAMLGAIAGLASREGVEVRGMDAAAVSYPGFERDLASLLGGVV